MKKNIAIILLSIVLSAVTSYFVADYTAERNAVEEDKATDTGSASERKTLSVSRAVDFSDAAEMAVNTVVYVKVVKRAPSNYGMRSLLDEFFGFARTPQDQVGLGSGVIIRSDGYIVTNNHVVNGADVIQVTLEDNNTYQATLVGTDPATDIALLKIEASDLPAIELGDSDELRLGEWVLAIGSPYDLRSTITAGIVSAKGRSLPNYDGQYRVESFIQTDAAVNPGNSGGALVNASGRLVGINTSIISLTGSYAGYSFAVPVNIVKKITDDFIQYGEVRRAMLGIAMTEINAEIARQIGLDSPEGVYIAEVHRGGVADKAGIKAGDVLVEINLNKIKNTASVMEQVSRLRPGEQAVLTIIRNGERKEVIVSL